ncbi:MAG TPA: hypothetical protein VK177_12260, partial [Flavobacteriales bacterium]|nr:hypothetical protein [Flavobacteriales bacterium]
TTIVKTEEVKSEETGTDEIKTEETATEPTDEEDAGTGPEEKTGDVKLQLVQGPSGMILNVSKSTIGKEKNANELKVEVKDAEGGTVFEYEDVLTNGSARVSLKLGNGTKGVLSLTVSAGGESADMQIVKL